MRGSHIGEKLGFTFRQRGTSRRDAVAGVGVCYLCVD